MVIELPTDAEPVRVIQGEALDVLRSVPDGCIDAVVTDPPYGMSANLNSKRFSGGNRALRPVEGRDNWQPIHGDDEPFDPSPWLMFPKVVLWGYHHFAQRLPVGTVLTWIKKADHLFGTFLSDCELAWMKGGHGVYAFRKQFPPPSRAQEGRHGKRPVHPTQKPISLMRWCIQKCKLPPNSLILDPFGGSGTTAIAALREGHRCIIIEKEPAYVEIIHRRVREAMGTGLLSGIA